ncbi:DUF4232 domain-containing protein [Streptacidiphilus sp. PB12-B1b]|uniref:DUF4232 domain-containing protein n=1 Tax=Streptacidiphilus sp. PB12-B1b TaxID=2705012 RepID=UPI0015F86DC4|nr:DUF4232 domain-containing protein [Streptacidiphilus sp. PB12-B1b]QMU78981.1 DUF4232 domain-containing protein [Streptacidiphilus sp. PB12-B1b]
MTTPSNARRRILPLALLAAGTTLALTACGGATGSSSTAAGGAAPSSATSAAASTGGSAAPQSSAPAGSTGSTGGSSTKGSTGSTGGSASGTTISSGSSDATSDAYAYKHPCAGDRLAVKSVYDPSLGATKRLIEVTDTGSTACGLSYYPMVAIDASATINVGHGQAETMQPKVPGGLGGAPYYALYAGRTAYAVVDLDPSHSTAGAGRSYDQLSVIASSDLPNVYEVDTKIVEEGGGSGNPYVKAPFLGLYRSTVADAAASANPANG